MLELNKIYQGDCLEFMKEIDDGSVNLILCDLPYQMTDNKWDKKLDMKSLWECYRRIIKDNGVIVLTAQQPFTTDLINAGRDIFRYNWVWEKAHVVNFPNAKKMPMRKTEDILVFSKVKCGNHCYNPQGLKRMDKTIDKEEKNEKQGNYRNSLKAKYFQEFTGYPHNLIYFANPNYKSLHPTQKPLELWNYLVKTYTNEGDLVLDNTAGSCTTAVSCSTLKRNWICLEKEKEYCEIGEKRLKELEGSLFY